MSRETDIPSQEEINGLYRAAEVAEKEGDNAHGAALRKSARFKSRLLREIDAGLDGTVAIFMGANS